MIDLKSIQKTKVTTDLGAMNVLIYGAPKVGKSTLASQIPNALFLATERGHNFLEVNKVDISSWEDALDVGKALLTQEHKYKTLVIDIADYFYKLCERYVMEKHQVSHPSDLAFGKGFALVKDEFTRVVSKLNSVGCGMCFVSHSKEKTNKTKTGEWTVMGTSMPATAENVIGGMCDLILYCYVKDDGTRVMRTKPTKYILAGDRSKVLPELMPMDYRLLIDNLKQAKSDNHEPQSGHSDNVKHVNIKELKNHAPQAKGEANV